MASASAPAQWLRYYRNSLVDADRMGLPVTAHNSLTAGSLDKIDQSQLEKLLPKYVDKNGRKVTAAEAAVQIAPVRFTLSTTHSEARTDNTLYPFWIPARITREGDLLTPGSKNEIPWFIRDVLSPVGEDSPLPVLGALGDFDTSLDAMDMDATDFDAYLDQARKLYKDVVGSSVEETTIGDYERKVEYTLVISRNRGVSRALIDTYDAFLREREPVEIPPLAGTILSAAGGVDERSLPTEQEIFLDNEHLGQLGSSFPLGDSQRYALYAHLRTADGEVLAVNGPPGTGKTTLLQSVVSNAMVEAAAGGRKPPKILASSTNNQAITNILQNFAAAGRDTAISRPWISLSGPLGTYMATEKRADQWAAEGQDAPTLVVAKGDIDGTYFERTSELDVKEEEARLVRALGECFGDEASATENAGDATAFLYKKLNDEIGFIRSCINAAGNLRKIFGDDSSPFAALDSAEKEAVREERASEERLEAIRNVRWEFNRFLDSESRLRRLFSFLPFARRARLRDVHSRLRGSLPAEVLENVRTVEELGQRIGDIEEQHQAEADNASQHRLWLRSSGRPLHTLRARLETYSKTDPTGSKIVSRIVEKDVWYKGIAAVLDVTARYQAFALAAHYWEARWLDVISERRRDFNKGAKGRRELYEELSYLTPLFVATCHSLTRFVSYFEKDSEGNWAQKPLTSLFDLVIMDEAGQVTPEVGVAPFLFGQRGLVVGDVYQIKPIWAIPSPRIDAANIAELELSKSEEDLQNLLQLGLTASSGSAMQLAQRVSPYRHPADLEVGGVLLREHRRCADEIIEFCNHYVYRNRLLPLAGSLASKKQQRSQAGKKITMLPAVGYAHIPGLVQRTQGGSRFNTIEAAAIAAFLETYGEDIRAEHGNAPLHELVGIVTPFKAQERVVRDSLDAAGLNEEGRLVVGTVHALQGSERPIIIFSPTYDLSDASGKGTKFFDADWNMLNVAVSRAKEHFLVIGEMGLFNPSARAKPSGALGKILFQHPEQEISSAFFFQQTPHYEPTQRQEDDLVDRIDTLRKHVRALERAFEIATQRIVIVSPFISSAAIAADRLAEKIATARRNDVEVRIYTDSRLDMRNGKLKDSAKEGRQLLERQGAELKVKQGIHNKALAVDNFLLIEGSFNWLSAQRDESAPYHRHEVSVVVKTGDTPGFVERLLSVLDAMPAEEARNTKT